MQNNLAIISQRLKMVQRNLPSQVGVIMVAFTKQRFKEQNWLDTYPEKWQRRSRKKQWSNKGKVRNNKGRAILNQTSTLMRGNRIVNTTANSVTIGNAVPYAAVHNNGERINVTQRVRQFTRMNPKRDQYQVVAGKQGKKSSRVKYQKSASGISVVKAHDRHMNFKMPRRRFMGNSKYLNMQISRFIGAEIYKCFRP